MTGRIIQFEIGCRDKPSVSRFYEGLFGWSVGAGPNIYADRIDGADLEGHLVSLGHEPHNYVLVYVEVDDIEAAVLAASDLQGELVIGPLPLPDGRQFAWLKDPEGTLVGLIGRASDG